MNESLIVKHCSPTLARIKTGNLINCCFNCIEELKTQIENVNSVLNLKGVYMRLLRTTFNKALIYVYRPDKLMNDLMDNDVRNLLRENGYFVFDVENCINKLSSRLCECEGFPHEIGLFLGYPLNDVKGFVENNGKNFKLAGYWKVYSDEYKAKEIFKKYKKCTNIYCKKLSEGLSIQRLTVAV